MHARRGRLVRLADFATGHHSAMAPQLLITCPSTGEPVSTGVGMERSDFDAVDIEGREFGCPACGETHIWQKSEAFFDPDDPAGQR